MAVDSNETAFANISVSMGTSPSPTSSAKWWMSDAELGGIIAGAVGGFSLVLVVTLIAVYLGCGRNCRRRRRQLKRTNSTNTFTYAKQYNENGADTSSGVRSVSPRSPAKKAKGTSAAAAELNGSTPALSHMRDGESPPMPLEPDIVIVPQRSQVSTGCGCRVHNCSGDAVWLATDATTHQHPFYFCMDATDFRSDASTENGRLSLTTDHVDDSSSSPVDDELPNSSCRRQLCGVRYTGWDNPAYWTSERDFVDSSGYCSNSRQLMTSMGLNRQWLHRSRQQYALPSDFDTESTSFFISTAAVGSSTRSSTSDPFPVREMPIYACVDRKLPGRSVSLRTAHAQSGVGTDRYVYGTVDDSVLVHHGCQPGSLEFADEYPASYRTPTAAAAAAATKIPLKVSRIQSLSSPKLETIDDVPDLPMSTVSATSGRSSGAAVTSIGTVASGSSSTLSDEYCRRFVDEAFGAIVNPAYDLDIYA